MKAPDSKPGLITYPPSPHDLPKAIWINVYGEGEAAGPVTKASGGWNSYGQHIPLRSSSILLRAQPGNHHYIYTYSMELLVHLWDELYENKDKILSIGVIRIIGGVCHFLMFMDVKINAS